MIADHDRRELLRPDAAAAADVVVVVVAVERIAVAVRRWRSSPAAVSARHVNHCEDTPVRIATGYVSVAPGRGIDGRVPD